MTAKRAIFLLLILLALPALACSSGYAPEPTPEPRTETTVNIQDSQGTAVIVGDNGNISQPNEFSSEPVAAPLTVLGIGAAVMLGIAALFGGGLLVTWLVGKKLQQGASDRHVRQKGAF